MSFRTKNRKYSINQGELRMIDDKFIKHEMAAGVSFICCCMVQFIDNEKLYQCGFTISALCLLIFTVKAVLGLIYYSNIKKALLIIAQFVGYFILYVIWLVIWLEITGGSIISL